MYNFYESPQCQAPVVGPRCPSPIPRPRFKFNQYHRILTPTPMQRASFHALPQEVVRHIVDEVTSIDDVRRLRTVNKALCALATPNVFHVVGTTNRPESALGLIRLLESLHISQHVWEVTYRDEEVKEDGTPIVLFNRYLPKDNSGVTPDRGSAAQELLVQAFSLAADLPAVEALCFTFHPQIVHTHSTGEISPDNHQDVVRDALHLQEELLKTVTAKASRLSSRLRSLTLNNLTPMPIAVYDSESFHTLLASLTRLRIAIKSDEFRYHEDQPEWFEFWRLSIPNAFLPHLTSLTSLTLYNDQHFQQHPLDWKDVLLPQLKYLSVVYMEFSEEIDEEDEFVARHEKLEWLDKATGPNDVRWVRRTHADPEDHSEYEFPPSETTRRWAGIPRGKKNRS
ncbi:hypothetical protein FA95DRAFT_1344123 [Auriscalpium vulgare]|uniref:Uncharacterized protein n=1 Tax=Auriscalpium vulgare TaxID=40419 RepID=A0ACB8RRV0_9AGAM|nr:hypothetical protein FA95DRAFT_1344123 [Auriscalpium vulgare]